MASILNATTSSGLVTSADNSGSLQLATNNGTTAVTIDTSQNVGIGTSSPTNLLHVEKSYSGTIAKIKNNAGSTSSDAGLEIETNTTAAKTLLLKNGGTEIFSVLGDGNLKFNSGYGSAAVAYGCRAWVNFNGTGTPAIRGSGNVSSITDNGTGDYTVNFTTALPDANYAVFGNTTRDTFLAGVAARFCTPHTLATGSVAVPTFNIDTNGAVVLEDLQFISVSVIR